LLWASLIPYLKEKKRKGSSWLATSISFFIHVHSILKDPVLYGARAGVRSRVRTGGKGGRELFKERKEKILGAVRKAGTEGQKRKHTPGDRHKHAFPHSCEPGQGGWTVLL
jgi:hypothetical protein